MRRSDPIIIGAGPAGCAAAITLAQGGAKPLILERATETGDALCGGFLSWRTIASLERLGVHPAGHMVDHLTVFSGARTTSAPLPDRAMGLSRRAMDTALLAAAIKAGAGVERGVMVRHLDELKDRTDTVFLATGKHDLKGAERPRADRDPAMGLRVRLPATAALDRLVGTAIELHMFDRGYAGIELQEDGSANICLALRKSLLTEHNRDPRQLLISLGNAHPAFGARLTGMTDATPVDAIAAVPYGWHATETASGLFRIGDQAGVIPSLAGEGNGIALASGRSAAEAFLHGGAAAAQDWQPRFGRQSQRPIGRATAIWRTSERAAGRGLIMLALSLIPGLAPAMARATRIEA
jgi:flavin-dependent dehydrogenase